MADDDVVLRIGADMTPVVKGLQDIQKQLEELQQSMRGFSDKSKEHFDKAGNFFDNFTKKIVGGGSAAVFIGNLYTKAFDQIMDGLQSVVFAIPNLITSTAEVGDELLTMSKKTGVSVEALSQMRLVASQSGVSLDSMANGIRMMNLELGKGGDGVEKAANKLGFSLQKLREMQPEEAFQKLIKAMEKFPNAAMQAKLGGELFGKSWKQVSALVGEDLAGLMDKADKMGLTFTKAQAQMADRFNDSLDMIKQRINGFLQQVGLVLLPAATAIFEVIDKKLAELFERMGLSGKDWQDKMLKLSRNVLQIMGKFVEQLIPIGVKISNVFFSITDSIIGLFETVSKAGTFFEKWKKFWDDLGPKNPRADKIIEEFDKAFPFVFAKGGGDAGLMGLMKPLKELGEEMPNVRAGLEKARKGIEDFARSAQANITPALTEAFDELEKTLRGDGKKKKGIGGALSEDAEALEKAQEAFQKGLKELATTVKVALSTTAPDWNHIVDTFGGSALKLMQAARDIPNAFKGVSFGVETAMNFLAKTFAKKELDKSIIEFNSRIRDGLMDPDGGLSIIRNLISSGAAKPVAGFPLPLATGFKGIPLGPGLPSFAKTTAEHVPSMVPFGMLGAGGAFPLEGGLKSLFGTGKVEEKIVDVNTALAETVDLFETMSEIAQNSFSQVSKSIGMGLTALLQFKKGLDVMTAPKAFSWTNLLAGLSSIIGAISTGIQLAKQLFDMLSRSESEKIASDLRRQFGIDAEETDEFVKDIEKTIERLGIARNQAITMHLPDILKQAGGLNPDNITDYLDRTYELFGLWQKGGKVAREALGPLNDMFRELAQYELDQRGLFSPRLLQMIQEARGAGVELSGLSEILGKQMDQAAAGLAGYSKQLQHELMPAMDDLLELEEERKELEEELNELKEEGASLDEDEIERMEEINAKILAIDKKIKGVKQEAVATTQDDFDRLSRTALATFNALVANGKTAVEAIDAISPSIDFLTDSMKEFGFSSNDAIGHLARLRTLSEENRPLLESIAGLNDLMKALANLGGLTQETFNDMQVDGVEAFEKLKEVGFSEREALEQMAPYLETVRDLHYEKGLAIDETTAKLIAQAEEQGIIAEKEKSVQDILKEGLGEIIKLLGGDLPKAWKTMSDAADKAGKTATKAMLDTSKGVIDTGKHLETTDWTSWADDLAGAAGEAQKAIDGVSLGHSPGGIKEIAIQFAKAKRAALDFTQNVKGYMYDAEVGVDRAAGAFGAGGRGGVTVESGAVVIDRPILKDRESMAELAQEVAKSLKWALNPTGAWT